MMPGMQKLIGATLAALCCCTIAAACFLALSYLTLKGTANLQPIATLTVFAAQSILTLAALALARSSGVLDALVMASAAALIWIGWSVASATLAGPHFEGYALVMGAIGIVQGALALARFLLFRPRHALAT
jgi:hypothetical protein